MSLVKHIPNCITTLNLVFGIVGVVFAFEGKTLSAFYMMLAALLFDFCDGLAARALKSYSPMGKELDSLCDMVSFGALPSIMMYDIVRTYVWTSATYVAFLPLVFSIGAALRLAKFNVDERQHSSFRGLAAPAAAIAVASLCCYADAEPNSLLGGLCTFWWFLPAVSVFFVALMLCDLPMMSFKFSREDGRAIKMNRIFFVADCAVILAGVLLLGEHWTLAVMLMVLLYVIKNMGFALGAHKK